MCKLLLYIYICILNLKFYAKFLKLKNEEFVESKEPLIASNWIIVKFKMDSMVAEVIPGFWVVMDEQNALWPPAESSFMAQVAVEERYQPDENWQLLEIEEIMAPADILFLNLQ